MSLDSSRPPRDGDTRTRAAIILGVLVFVGGFVLTMTFLGISPWEAVGVAVAAGAAAGTITRALLDLLASGPPRPDRPEPAEPPTEGPTDIAPEPKPEQILPESTGEVS
jgi:hypothetical protein